MRLISGEKNLNHVSIQKVVTVNTCCDVACLAFQLPRITEPTMSIHNQLFSEPPTFEGMQQTFSRLKKLSITQVNVVTFSGVLA